MIAALVLAACSTKQPEPGFTVKAAPTPTNPRFAPAPMVTNSVAPIVTPGGAMQGQVASVNANGRFVVLSYPIGGLPSLEKRLNVYHNGLKVAELKVTGPQRDNNIVADIVAGQCAPGDQTRED
jgi:hypothetical protein